MRTRKSVSIQRESWTSNMEHLHLWTSPQLAEWERSAWCIIARLAEMIATKKGEQYAKTISWITTRTSFALLKSALVCLRGSRTRRVPCDIKNVDIDVEVVKGAIQSHYWCVSSLLNGKYSSLTHCERCLIFLFFQWFVFIDYLSKNAIDLENSFSFFIRNELF